MTFSPVKPNIIVVFEMNFCKTKNMENITLNDMHQLWFLAQESTESERGSVEMPFPLPVYYTWSILNSFCQNAIALL